MVRRKINSGICCCGDHAWAVLTRGFVTIVSQCDYHLISEQLWHTLSSKKHGLLYATRWSGILLHREIMAPPKSIAIDHKNHNGLDNRRSNIRHCTYCENQGNGRYASGSSVFRGVSWRKDRHVWRAKISINDHTVNLGQFNTEGDAARAYDDAAIKHFGSAFARLNFPQKNSPSPS